MFWYQKLVKELLLTAIIFSGLSLPINASSTNATLVPQKFLTINKSIDIAQQYDPWIVASEHTQNAIEAESEVAAALPAPQVSLGVANIAADTLSFNQEAMTQFKLGVSQVLPRGDSLSLKQKQLSLVASQQAYLREDRKAKVAVITGKLWLDVYKAQESIVLIESNRVLFEQMVDIAQASYSSALGKTRQHDIVRAQLELTRLDDRLEKLKQSLQMSQQKLFEWIGGRFNPSKTQKSVALQIDYSDVSLVRDLPDIKILRKEIVDADREIKSSQLYQYFSAHPQVSAMAQKLKASESGIALAKQKYKPEWKINASYGYRSDDPNGFNRSDLFSIGVSFDLPIFTKNKQDKQVLSAVEKKSVIKTQKWALVRQLVAAFKTNQMQLQGLTRRQQLYQHRLLPQIHDQADAALTAYTNGDGDFSEVVRSRIAELNSLIEALDIDVERQKTIVQLNYYFMQKADEIVMNNRSQQGENS